MCGLCCTAGAGAGAMLTGLCVTVAGVAWLSVARCGMLWVDMAGMPWLCREQRGSAWVCGVEWRGLRPRVSVYCQAARRGSVDSHVMRRSAVVWAGMPRFMKAPRVRVMAAAAAVAVSIAAAATAESMNDHSSWSVGIHGGSGAESATGPDRGCSLKAMRWGGGADSGWVSVSVSRCRRVCEDPGRSGRYSMARPMGAARRQNMRGSWSGYR